MRRAAAGCKVHPMDLPPATAIRKGPYGRTVTLGDGRQIMVRSWSGVGEPLVLLHGLLDSGLGWTWLAEHSERPFVALDLPGFGFSDMPRHPRFDAYADDVIATLDALGIHRCVLVGHSFGGGIAAIVADRYPARVASLVLLAPAGFGRIRLAEAVSLPGVRNLTSRALPLALANSFVLTAAYVGVVTNRRLPDPEQIERVRRRALMATPGARDATNAVVTAGRSDTAMHRRRLRYEGPAHVLWGDRDRVVPPGHVDGVLLALPRAVVEVWEGMGHHPQRERPDDLAHFVERAARGARPTGVPDLPEAA